MLFPSLSREEGNRYGEKRQGAAGPERRGAGSDLTLTLSAEVLGAWPPPSLFNFLFAFLVAW